MDSREQIIVQAMHLFMRYGVRSVTMDDLAGSMGISKKTLYQFVKNKEDLLDGLLDHMHCKDTNELAGIIAASKDAIDALLNVAKMVSQKLELISPVTIYDLKKYYPRQWAKIDDYERKQIYSFTLENLERGKREGLYREDIDTDFIARLHVGQSMMVTDESIFPSDQYTKTRLMFSLMHHYIMGISTEKGRTVLSQRMQELLKNKI